MHKGYDLYKLNKKNIMEFLNYNIDGQFSIEKIANIETLKKIQFKYAIIYNFDCVESDKIEYINLDIDNIIEARFFDEEREIRIFRDEDKCNGTIFIEKQDANYIEKDALLYARDNKKTYPKRLISRKYIDYDEDNQAYIRYTKPSSLHFKEVNNEANKNR